MTITQKMKKLAQILKDAYPIDENRIYIKEETLYSKLDEEDIKYGIRHFEELGIITKIRNWDDCEVYSRHKTPLVYLSSILSGQPQDNIVFTIDSEKLQTFLESDQSGSSTEGQSSPLQNNLSTAGVNQNTDKFTISVKDREIWINNYLIGKPHAVGSNFEFFEYILSQAPHTKISREALPSFGGNLSLKEQVKSKGFIKILNELGFKGEVLKAFFYKRSKNTLIYRGDEITKEDLEKAGIKKHLFLKELELAHIRNSPE